MDGYAALLSLVSDYVSEANRLLIELSTQKRHDEDMVDVVTSSEPVIEEVLRIEDLPIGSMATRRALVGWSDGTESEALRWYADLCGCPT